jgi:ribosomal protein S18 acetylase RimI-like enzyme
MIWLEELQTRKKISKIFLTYEKTFPADERRNKDQFFNLLERPNCYIFGVKNEAVLVGYVILWGLKDFYFLEHFEVFEEYRNLKLGSQILTEVKEHFGPLVLESEPRHLNEMAERRINFYIRNGFSIISETYWQPSYEPGKNSLNLFLMSDFEVKNVTEMEQEIFATVYS